MASKTSCIDSLDANFISQAQKYCPNALQRNGDMQDEAQEEIEEDYCDASRRI
jgi:hypothetical protein